MLFSIFVLINIIFTLAFFYTIYRAAVLLKKEVGVWASVIFILGILSQSSNSSENGKTDWKFNSDKVFVKGTRSSKNHIIEDNFLSKVGLFVSYGLDSTSKEYLPIEAKIINQGLSVRGSKFIPDGLIIRQSESPKLLEYQVYGMRKWQFFVILKYNESKKFTGFISIK